MIVRQKELSMLTKIYISIHTIPKQIKKETFFKQFRFGFFIIFLI